MNLPEPAAPEDCFACKAAHMPGDIAFTAGIAFAGQYNGESVMSRICARHRVMLAAGHLRTRALVKPGQGRLDD